MRKAADFFSGFKNGFSLFGHNISLIVNSALLFIVYIIGVGITSIIAKIFGKHFLKIKEKEKNSYWEYLGLGKKDTDEYYRQF